MKPDMPEIGELEGINSGEVKRFCRAGITTVERFLEHLDPDFIYGIMHVSIKTSVKPSRLLQLLLPDRVPLSEMPDIWIEELTERVLREAPADENWIWRCGYSIQNRINRLKGNWGGWKQNLPILFLSGAIFLVIGLTLRAAGGLQWLPYPLSLTDRALVTADTMEAGKVLASADTYPALLPSEKDYFKPDQNLEGLILAQKISGQTPLRFRHVLRQQVTAARDIQRDSIVLKDDLTVSWSPYKPGVALSLEEVVGHKAAHSIQKGMDVRLDSLERKE